MLDQDVLTIYTNYDIIKISLLELQRGTTVLINVLAIAVDKFIGILGAETRANLEFIDSIPGL